MEIKQYMAGYLKSVTEHLILHFSSDQEFLQNY